MSDHSIEIQARAVRIILCDILDCAVRLNRLSSPEIARATHVEYRPDGHQNTIQLHNHHLLAAHQIDHNYSLQPHHQESSHTNDGSSCKNTESVQMDHSSDDDTGASYVDALNSPSSLCSSDFTFSESDNSDDNIDQFANTEPIPYPSINLGNIDDVVASQNNGEHLNGFVITTNGMNRHNSEIGINRLNGSANFNGMNSYSNSNASPNHATYDDDEDEDLRFLYGLKEELDQSANQNGLMENCDENGKIWPSVRILDNVCLKFLTGACLNPYCEYRHELPSIELFQRQLNGASSTSEILEFQNHILLRYDVLMATFFKTFCLHCGRKWQCHRENLRTMIGPLSTRPLAATYMNDIVNGFLVSGMKYSTCVNQLMFEYDLSLNMDDQFNILWALIIDPRNDKITDHLKMYEIVFSGDALPIVDAINGLLEYQIRGEMEELREFTVTLVKKCRIATFRRIDTKLLQNYITHVRLFDLNASKMIEQKATKFNFMADTDN